MTNMYNRLNRLNILKTQTKLFEKKNDIIASHKRESRLQIACQIKLSEHKT